MATITITPGVEIDANDFWIGSATASTNERFTDQTSLQGGTLLGIGQTRSTYDEFTFDAGGRTYRYLGNWQLTTDGGLLSDSLNASGSYTRVVLEQNGNVLASLTPDAPVEVNFGSQSGVSVLGLDLLNPVLNLLLAGDPDQSIVNLHLVATPNLADLVGIDIGDLPGTGGGGSGGTPGPDTIPGTGGNDTISGLAGNDLINGGAGDDILFGNEGNDTINGEGGNDSLFGGQNDDLISGGDGNDYIVGQLGSDVINGNAGDDLIFGGNETIEPADISRDTVYGGDGNDTVYGNAGEDLVFGGRGFGDQAAGNDSVYGGKGNDTVHGNAGDDQVFGNIADDLVFGDEGNDYVNGGQNNDTMSGGTGNDTLDGALNDDRLTGDAGSDLFVFQAGQGNDVVTDFSFAGGDRLDLRGQSYTLATTNDGSAALSLGGGGTIVLLGLTPQQFQADFVV